MASAALTSLTVDQLLQLLSTAYGVNSYGVDALTLLKRSREVTRESFLQPQPVGLTNTQCQILGPYFTTAPTHCHPEALRDPSKGQRVLQGIFSIRGLDASSLAALPKFDVNRADVTYSEEEMALAEENLMLMASCLADRDLSSFHQVALLTSRQDPRNAFLVNGLKGVKTVSLKIPRFGSRLARALSMACVGVDCYWNVFKAHLERLLQDKSAVAAMCDAIGLDEGQHVGQMLTYLRSGMELPLLQTQGLLFLAAQIVRRPIVLLPERAEFSAVFVFLPSMAPPEERSKAPVMLCRIGDEIDSVLVPTSSDPVWVSPKFEMVIYLPLGLAGREGEFCELHSDPSHGTVLLNPVQRAREHHTVFQLPMTMDCAKHQGPNSALLSFSSFPPTAFSLAGDEATAATLLQSRGYGRDHCGAKEYLIRTLSSAKNLEIVHVDADGHCLAHSLSRCLVGKEYFWHALRTELYETMRQRKPQLLEFLKRNAVLAALEDDYDSITDRANPDREYPDGCALALASWRGLGTEHIFVLANILKRPILLLDGVTENRESYFFLPLLHAPEECSTKKVLVVAWSGSSHGHYVPVVSVLRGVESSIDDTVLPRNSATQEYVVYGLPDGASAADCMSQYVEFGESPRRVIVGGECELDARPWCQAAVDAFEAEHKYSVWMIHEACRCLLREQTLDHYYFSSPRSIPHLTDIIDQLVRLGCIRYCATCASTTPTSSTVHSCHYCGGRTIAFRIQSGMLVEPFKAHDRMPVESSPDYRCCLFKHWAPYSTDEGVQVGSYVYARDLASSFQIGKLVGISLKSSTYDVQFLSGTAADIRFNCPATDVQLGVPCDSVAEIVPLPLMDGSEFVFCVRYDADERIRCDPKSDAHRVVEAYSVHPLAPPHFRLSVPAYKIEIKRRLETTLTEIVTNYTLQTLGRDVSNEGRSNSGAQQREELHSYLTSVSATSWSCSRCTYINEPTQRTCAMCDRQRSGQ